VSTWRPKIIECGQRGDRKVDHLAGV